MFESGSFRDREAKVLYHDDKVLRVLSQNGYSQWKYVSGRKFFADAVRSGKVVETREIQLPQINSLDFSAQHADVALHHTRVPFISYPYEWCFEMLRDAALLQLDLLRSGLIDGVQSKDCSAFNFQWFGSRPVCIDTGSFERREAGNIWPGYLQFCEMFLFPLMLQAYRGIPFQNWLRGDIEGVSVRSMAKLLRWRDVAKPGVLRHVFLQHFLQQQFNDPGFSVREVMREQISDKAQLALMNNLTRILERLPNQAASSAWTEYSVHNSYTQEEGRAKRDFVARCTGRKPRNLTWDLGCNNGAFSRVAAQHSSYVVALDSDTATIDALYSKLRAERQETILPLVVNLANPSPAMGWRGRERKRLEERGKPDLILCLALLHHLVIRNNIPMSEIIEWLASFGADIVIEFVSKEDPMTKRLLQNKRDIHGDYNLTEFEALFARHFRIAERLALAGGSRVLFYGEHEGS